MPSYIALAKFTDQGIRTVKQTVSRADAAREAASRFGVRMETIYWTQGQYDIVTICEAQDEAAMSAFSLAVAASGNVKFETLRAFSRDEMANILKKLA
ncbi:GYD domain-containing protein [Ramlibacter sp. PS3R-8]|uniref:GYD domain-containing protein n=1 Tax=Ramlibacter sp. PS3R-8 TaxID=3133437 RepID=UPI00309A463E